MYVRVCIVWLAKKLIVDLEIAYLPFHFTVSGRGNRGIDKKLQFRFFSLFRFTLAGTMLMNQSLFNNESRVDRMRVCERFDVCLNDIRTG